MGGLRDQLAVTCAHGCAPHKYVPFDQDGEGGSPQCPLTMSGRKE